MSHKDLANALRFLAIDAVNKANSGHPGAPMGMADLATVLWRKFLKHNPQNPSWINRDRFVLSNGHASMLLYGLLHLSGYNLTIQQIKKFRQLGSQTAGHPEFGLIEGIETTTGPLGQGIANAVGMALAEKMLAHEFNEIDFPIIDHHTYAFVGDGCLMEGISHEVCSLAGTLQLNKLIVIYDANGISIDGKIDSWFDEDVAMRFRSYHWNVVDNVDGHDEVSINKAISEAKLCEDRPTIIIARTRIGFGAGDMEGTHKVHGSPLGSEGSKIARTNLNWSYEPFVIPDNIYDKWSCKESGAEIESNWQNLWNKYQDLYPQKASDLIRRTSGILPEKCLEHLGMQINSWQKEINDFLESDDVKNANAKCLHTMATRKASLTTLNYFAPNLPELFGGSADLSPSNLTQWVGSKEVIKDSSGITCGNYIHYGVREFGMSAIGNGLALHGGVLPFVSTFFVFIDYAKSALRLSSLMKQKVVYVLTHDSIGVGEDGPTHQPIEQLTMIRTIPGVMDWRPCDLVETAISWQESIKYQGPSTLILSRQDLQPQSRDVVQVKSILKGGYVLYDLSESDDTRDILTIIASGSEVSLAIDVAHKLYQLGTSVRVVSMPSVNRFLQQSKDYQLEVLGQGKRIAIEMAHSTPWYRFVGSSGLVIGIDSFGESGAASDLFDHFGFTTEKILSRIQAFLKV